VRSSAFAEDRVLRSSRRLAGRWIRPTPLAFYRMPSMSIPKRLTQIEDNRREGDRTMTREMRIEDLTNQLRVKVQEFRQLLDAIDEVYRRLEREEHKPENRPATPPQLNYLQILGYKPKRELTMKEASLLISALTEVRKEQKRE